jgi:lipid-A-disaccharide synthase-like uncharacterized protein
MSDADTHRHRRPERPRPGGGAGPGGIVCVSGPHAGPRRLGRTLLLIAAALIMPLPVLAVGSASMPAAGAGGFKGAIDHFLNQLHDPWTWFGLCAQGLFFLRFFWQWVVSERHKQSIVPVAFWYFSLGGAVSMFMYGTHRRDLVVMLGGLLPTVIYIRNLMLIYGRAEKLRRAGLPTQPLGSPVTDRDLPD